MITRFNTATWVLSRSKPRQYGQNSIRGTSARTRARKWCGRRYVLQGNSASGLFVGCATSDSVLILLVALPLLSWETVVDCDFERFQVHGLSYRKIWFVVILVSLNLLIRVRRAWARAEVPIDRSSHIHHVIDACIPALYYSENARSICVL